jgi:hypothetical protein
MTRRERLKKLIDRRKQREQIIVVQLLALPGGHPERPMVIGGTPAQRDAILAKWDAENPNIPPRATGPWTKAPESSPGAAPVPAPARQLPAGAPTVHDRPAGDISAPLDASLSSTRRTCDCGALGEEPVGGYITCRTCGTVFCG